jgi:outer membrane protein TolC
MVDAQTLGPQEENLQYPAKLMPPVTDLVPAQPEPTDRPLPINLATALRLSDARPLIIAAAQASVQKAAADLSLAQTLWLPDIYYGAVYDRHDGSSQGNSGTLAVNSKDQFLAGGGLTAVFSSADAIFAPLAARQVLRSKQFDVQAARNDALEDVAEAYFDVQQARGRLAGALDANSKSVELEKKVGGLARGLVSVMELNRVRAETAEVEQNVALVREDWRVASADLTRILRLDPTALVMPLEAPHLQITLVSSKERVDDLVVVGLTNRPELASQQALVQAALARLRQEQLRPLMPSLVLTGNGGSAMPGGYLGAGVYASGVSGTANPTGIRSDWSVQVLWQLKNLGFGNRALVRASQAEQQQALIELFRIQDMVAAEVTRAYAGVESATIRVAQAEAGLKEALIAYAGNLKGLGETTRLGDVLVLVTRPQEAVAAMQQLVRAYDNYYTTVAGYNRAQFRLYRALGYAAAGLACDPDRGPIIPIDTNRPSQMAPVCAPAPCSDCPR